MKKNLLTLSFLFSTIFLFSQTNISIYPTDTTVCKNAIVKIALNNFPSTATFEWRNSLGQIPSNESFIEVKGLVSEQYFCIVTNNNKKDTLQAKVAVKDKILLPIIASDTTICEGESVMLSTVFKGNSPLEWTHSQGESIACLDSIFCNKILVSPKSTWVYTFDDKSTCYSGIPTRIQVDKKPVFASPTEIVLCIGASSDSLTLNKAPETNVVYEWTQVGNPTFNSKLSNPKILPRENATYKVKMTKGACVTEETIKLIVANLFQLKVTEDTMICPNTPIKLEYKMSPSPSEFVHEWSPGGYDNPIVVTSSQSTNYILKLSYPSKKTANNYYCTTYDTVKVLVKNSPKIEIKATPSSNPEYVLGKMITLDVVPSTNNSTYGWEANGIKLTNNQSSLKTTLSDFKNVYKVTYKDEFGCTPTASIEINTYRPDVQFPTIFNAGEESFRPFYKDLKDGVVSLERFYIYNRWGQTVYEFNGQNGVAIDDNFKGWDGKKDDKEQPSDVYIVSCRIRYGDKSFEDRTLNITLIR